MRLHKVDDGHAFLQALKLRMMGLALGGEAPDVVKTLSYRPDLWGTSMNRLTQAVLRGPSPWSVADRELMASFVSNLNQCLF